MKPLRLLAAATALLAFAIPSTSSLARRPATIPEDALAGIRGCRVLLAHPASCERSVIRTANRRCRHLRTQRARINCLRAVRRVASRA